MKIDILSIFPEMFTGPFTTSIIKRAQEKKILEINVHNLRDYAYNKHKMTDDYPYGGGPGMVMKPEPIFCAVRDLKKDSPLKKVILLCPQGEPFTQKKARELACEKEIIFICGHYEGIDERVRKYLVTDEISIGDYVLTGGEIPAMVVVDAVARLLKGVTGDALSTQNESFSNELFDFPCYTRPEDFEGMKVPDILLSGNHEEVFKWRDKERFRNTYKKRPELLYNKYVYKNNVFIGLLHHSVRNKQQESVITSITNMDIHDISRVSSTYNIKKFYCINPIPSQKLLAERIINHWINGYGASYNSNRKEALTNIELIDTLENTIKKIKKEYGKKPALVLTDARKFQNNISYVEMRYLIHTLDQPFLIIFGTGWGIEEDIFKQADYILEPVMGIGEYNHLSVRSAVSIIIDRLLGDK
ncbi:MAG: tRNA (guanosine(37)-N1)-methyltransferase TrmD [Candidatus Firestonebacteria bacterium]|nr:tRNA (guanosine(37)-N1)-methyltransferase TrmD [Candidatus Firestonebacteria bacterium]